MTVETTPPNSVPRVTPARRVRSGEKPARMPFATLIASGETRGTLVLRHDKAKLLGSSDGRFTSRAPFPFDGERKVEFYELQLVWSRLMVTWPWTSRKWTPSCSRRPARLRSPSPDKQLPVRTP